MRVRVVSPIVITAIFAYVINADKITSFINKHAGGHPIVHIAFLLLVIVAACGISSLLEKVINRNKDEDE